LIIGRLRFDRHPPHTRFPLSFSLSGWAAFDQDGYEAATIRSIATGAPDTLYEYNDLGELTGGKGTPSVTTQSPARGCDCS
jgi:hypothetical protein